MIPKRFEDISKTDIDALLANCVPEGRTLDYKLILPGNKDDEKRELLADVSSLANAGGGDIVFGVGEAAGVPIAASGLPGIDPDAEILRLDNSIRTGIEPRIPGVRIKAIDGFTVGPIIVVRVPKSWSSPHMVIFKGSSRFFSRTNAGKFPMDVTEIRSAFLFSETITERMRRFRDDRLAKIMSYETPVPMEPGGKVVFHIFPVSAFSGPPTIDVREVASGNHLPPIVDGPWDDRLNVDGFVACWPTRSNEYSTYTQLFRSGTVEIVDGFSVLPQRLDIAYEKRLVLGVQKYLKLISALGIEPPLVFVLSMLGVKGVTLGTAPHFRRPDLVPAIDRDMVLLPDVLVDNLSQHPAKMLKPIFDTVWQAAGHPRSCNYDHAGEWKPQTQP